MYQTLSLDDFQAAARKHLPKPIYGFVAGGSETQASLLGNRASFDQWQFIPRVGVNTSKRSQKASLLGESYDSPFGIAPMGACCLAAYEADIILAQAASESGIPMILSSFSLTPLEDVASRGRSRWFQAYVSGERSRVTALLDRVKAAGFDHLVITMDVPVVSNRENDARNGFTLPLRPAPGLVWQGLSHPTWLAGTAFKTLLKKGLPHFENTGGEHRLPLFSQTAGLQAGRRDTLDWDDVAWIRRQWTGRLIVKGILARADARIARELSVDGIIVSNHGGRQLDGAVPPLHVLPGIAEEAGGVAVMIDGGMRRGADVLKALALGADFVFLGRPFLFAAAIAGYEGVKRAIAILRNEIDLDLAMLGHVKLSALTPEILHRTRESPGPETWMEPSAAMNATLGNKDA